MTEIYVQLVVNKITLLHLPFLLLILLLLFLKHYSPLWTMASNTIFLHSWHFLNLACLFFSPIIFKSSSTLSVHHLHGIPLFLVPSIVAFTVWFGIPSLCIHSAWPCHLSQRVFINFTIFLLVTYFLSHWLSFFSIILLLQVHVFSLQSSFQALWAWLFLPWSLSKFLAHRPVWVVLKSFIFLI